MRPTFGGLKAQLHGEPRIDGYCLADVFTSTIHKLIEQPTVRFLNEVLDNGQIATDTNAGDITLVLTFGELDTREFGHRKISLREAIAYDLDPAFYGHDVDYWRKCYVAALRAIADELEAQSM